MKYAPSKFPSNSPQLLNASAPCVPYSPTRPLALYPNPGAEPWHFLIITGMRVIGGTHQGRRLRTVGGLSVRPTSDRLRETLFNIISSRVADSRFLDICAGSGAVGIEALSRGASHVTFIENSRLASAVIQSNLNTIGITENATIIVRDAPAALRHLDSSDEEFDLVFFDPPYASGIYDHVLKRLGGGRLLSSEGLVIVEHLAKTPPQLEYGRLSLSRDLKQGESALAFYEPR